MIEFIWIDWNRSKIARHNLSETEVEHALRTGKVDLTGHHPVNGEYFESLGQCPNGRPIRIIWRYDVDWDGEQKAFVITAY